MTYKEWFDAYARHMVDVELYAEARAVLLEGTLNRLYRELKSIIESYGVIKSKSQENECIRECNECIRKYLNRWEDSEKKERDDFAGKEADWLSGIILAALGVALVSDIARKKRAMSTPFTETDTFETFTETLKADIQKSIKVPLLSSRIFGASTKSVTESLSSSFERIERNASAEIKTAVTGLQRSVTYQLLEDRRKLKFLYVSMFDERTCTVCAGYSGNVYEDLASAPAVPVHIRCRCYYMPILSSSDEIEGRPEDYEEWFKRQPDSVKYRILGPSRYSIYKSGLTSIKKFSSEGRKLTLEELFQKQKSV